MSKKIGGVFALVGLCALSLFLLNCGSSSSRPAGALYVLTQGSGGVGNDVTSYAIDLGSGNLSLISSSASTCTTQGTSCGPPLNIVLDAKGAAAFVLNQGVPSANVAPTIYPYSIGSDGSLSTPGTPLSWNCIGPSGAACTSYPDIAVSMAKDPAGQFLFVIDSGSPSSPVTCPARGVAANSTADVISFQGCPSISVFAMQAGSNALAFVSQSSTFQSPFFISKIPTGLSALSSTSSGATLEYLFVTGNHDICTVGCNPLHNDNTVNVYSVSSSGVLAELVNSPYATSTDPLSVQAVNTNPAGQTDGGVFVYVGSQPTASGALNIFEMCTVVDSVCSQADVNNALLMPVTTPPPPSPGANPVAMQVDPTNTFLYVVCEGSSQVFGYRIATTAGTLTALSPANQPTGSHPVALAMHSSIKSSGAFLYTSNSGGSNISGFSISTTTGSMSNAFTVSAPSVPSGMAAR